MSTIKLLVGSKSLHNPNSSLTQSVNISAQPNLLIPQSTSQLLSQSVLTQSVLSPNPNQFPTLTLTPQPVRSKSVITSQSVKVSPHKQSTPVSPRSVSTVSQSVSSQSSQSQSVSQVSQFSQSVSQSVSKSGQYQSVSQSQSVNKSTIVSQQNVTSQSVLNSSVSQSGQ
jgi:hypothetical protein